MDGSSSYNKTSKTQLSRPRHLSKFAPISPMIENNRKSSRKMTLETSSVFAKMTINSEREIPENECAEDIKTKEDEDDIGCSHFSNKFTRKLRDIRKSSFNVDRKVEILSSPLLSNNCGKNAHLE